MLKTHTGVISDWHASSLCGNRARGTLDGIGNYLRFTDIFNARSSSQLGVKWKTSPLPVGDDGGAVGAVGQEEAPDAEVVLDGPVVGLGVPVVELAYQRNRLRGPDFSSSGHHHVSMTQLKTMKQQCQHKQHQQQKHGQNPDRPRPTVRCFEGRQSEVALAFRIRPKTCVSS